MAMVSERALQKAEQDKERYKKLVQRAKQEGQVAVQAGIRTGAGMASAFGVSWIEGRYPDKATVFGVDVSLLVGVGATAAGAFNLAGNDKQTNEIMEAVGLGALCSFAAKRGAEMGNDAKNKAG